MGRGGNAEVGATRISQNGYHYTKTPTGWRLTHHVLMEEKLGRALEENERVSFKPGAKKFGPNNTPPSINDLILSTKGTTNVRQKLRNIAARAEDLQKDWDYWYAQLPEADKNSVGTLEVIIT